MKQVDRIHFEAMELVDQADHLRRLGKIKAGKMRMHQAFVKERRAAEMLADKLHFEPSRSVLYRSAACLALRCGEIREAERLIATALSGNPPELIAEELRDLLLEVYVGKSSRQRRRPFSKIAQPV